MITFFCLLAKFCRFQHCSTSLFVTCLVCSLQFHSAMNEIVLFFIMHHFHYHVDQSEPIHYSLSSCNFTFLFPSVLFLILHHLLWSDSVLEFLPSYEVHYLFNLHCSILCVIPNLFPFQHVYGNLIFSLLLFCSTQKFHFHNV